MQIAYLFIKTFFSEVIWMSRSSLSETRNFVVTKTTFNDSSSCHRNEQHYMNRNPSPIFTLYDVVFVIPLCYSHSFAIIEMRTQHNKRSYDMCTNDTWGSHCQLPPLVFPSNKVFANALATVDDVWKMVFGTVASCLFTCV